jgi:hypothetical protein
VDSPRQKEYLMHPTIRRDLALAREAAWLREAEAHQLVRLAREAALPVHGNPSRRAAAAVALAPWRGRTRRALPAA